MRVGWDTGEEGGGVSESIQNKREGGREKGN